MVDDSRFSHATTLRRALHNVCLNAAIGYITPKGMLTGQQEIHEDRTLEAASNNSRFVDRPCEKDKTPFSGRFRVNG